MQVQNGYIPWKYSVEWHMFKEDMCKTSWFVIGFRDWAANEFSYETTHRETLRLMVKNTHSTTILAQLLAILKPMCLIPQICTWYVTQKKRKIYKICWKIKILKKQMRSDSDHTRQSHQWEWAWNEKGHCCSFDTMLLEIKAPNCSV